MSKEKKSRPKIEAEARYRAAERDITARKREKENLRRMATVVRDSNDAITIQDFEGRITAWNRGAEKMYGYGEEEAFIKNIDLLTPPGKVEEQKDFIRRLIAGESITSFETQRVTKDGRVLDIWMTVTKLMDDNGKPVGLASTERDITGRKREEEKVLKLNAELEQRVVERTAQLEAANKKLEHQAMHDSLTGIFNRRAILDRLVQELSRAKREGGWLSLGMCDIDHFKIVNDTYGHQVGDEVLIAFTRCVQTGLREYDCVGRYGGEEFLVIASDKNGATVENLYGRLCSQVANNKIQTKAGVLSITVSIGVALGTGESSMDDLLAVADDALYQAKADGRNRVIHHTIEVGRKVIY